jgi:lipopolysaccharide heptosyltransferase II
MSRILIVNVNWLGDVLFSTPAIRAVRKASPKAHVACLVPARCREVLANNPYLDQVLVADDDTSFAGWPAAFALASRLRKEKFDTAIFFHRSKTKAFVARLAGIPDRLGYDVHGARRGLTRACPPPAPPFHRIDYFLGLVYALGFPEDGRGPDFFPRHEAAAELDGLFREKGLRRGEPYVIVHAGGNWDLKRWPPAHFTEWIRLFRTRFPWKVVLCGTAGEIAVAEKIRSAFTGSEVVTLCGRTSLDALALLLKGAKLLISNDSGPIHLAATQKTPILGIFGPTSAAETGPVSEGPVRIVMKDVGCEVPCYFRECDRRVCMEWITPEQAFVEAQGMLA